MRSRYDQLGLPSLILALMLLAACTQQVRPQTSADSEELKSKVISFLTELNKSLSDVKIDDIKPFHDSPFQTLSVSFTANNKRQGTEVYVTEDGDYLIIGQLWDLNLDPMEARWQRLKEAGEQNLAQLDLSDRPVKGNPNSDVVVVEFSDYQCPYCARAFEGVEKKLLADYGDRIRFVYKHLPLTSIHKWAMKASIAAVCGYVQDKEAFWKIHEKLFANQNEITEENLRDKVEQFAREAGLDTKAFLNCFDEEKTKAIILSDLNEASRLQISSTPTFLLDGAIFRGAPDYAEFSQFIDMALADTQTSHGSSQ